MYVLNFVFETCVDPLTAKKHLNFYSFSGPPDRESVARGGRANTFIFLLAEYSITGHAPKKICATVMFSIS
jgi:hypothetical protein